MSLSFSFGKRGVSDFRVTHVIQQDSEITYRKKKWKIFFFKFQKKSFIKNNNWNFTDLKFISECASTKKLQTSWNGNLDFWSLGRKLSIFLKFEVLLVFKFKKQTHKCICLMWRSGFIKFHDIFLRRMRNSPWLSPATIPRRMLPIPFDLGR